MRTLRLAQNGMVIVMLLGLLSIGPVTAADAAVAKDCDQATTFSDWIAAEERAKDDLVWTQDEIKSVLEKTKALQEQIKALQELLAALQKERSDVQSDLSHAQQCINEMADKDFEEWEKQQLSAEEKDFLKKYPVPVGDNVHYLVQCLEDGKEFHKQHGNDVPQLKAALEGTEFCLKNPERPMTRVIRILYWDNEAADETVPAPLK